MKKLLIVILCFAFLLPHSCNAEGNSNPLGLYTMTGEFLGIGMERTAIEEILGAPLNNPFPAPSPSTLSFVDFVMYIWRDSPLLDNYFDGYYCAYPGNIIVQYNFPFEWEEFASEPVYQRYLEMSNDIFNSDKQYTESDWESIYPELIELNYKYAEKSKLQSVAILISTVSFEYSTHDGFYVGKNTNEKYDIEEYYFATDDQSRKIQLEQVESSLISDSSKYSKSDFVELYIHLDRDNSIVTEICIKRLDGGYSEKASSIRNRYEHIIDDIISE